MNGNNEIIQEAKAIIGYAQSIAEDKRNITLQRKLPPLTDEECVIVCVDMGVKYRLIRQYSQRRTEIDSI